MSILQIGNVSLVLHIMFPNPQALTITERLPGWCISCWTYVPLLDLKRKNSLYFNMQNFEFDHLKFILIGELEMTKFIILDLIFIIYFNLSTYDYTSSLFLIFLSIQLKYVNVCMCVCVCFKNFKMLGANKKAYQGEYLC